MVNNGLKIKKITAQIIEQLITAAIILIKLLMQKILKKLIILFMSKAIIWEI